MLLEQEDVGDYSRCPHVCLLKQNVTGWRRPWSTYLCICKILDDLFWRGIEQSAALCEISYLTLMRGCKPKVDQLDLREVIVVRYHNIVGLNVPVDHVHRVMEVLERLKYTPHYVGALTVGQICA